MGDNICMHCGEKFVADDYIYREPVYRGNNDNRISFLGYVHGDCWEGYQKNYVSKHDNLKTIFGMMITGVITIGVVFAAALLSIGFIIAAASL